MASNKIQFRSIHELKDPALNNKLAQKEFQEEIPVEDFLGDAEKNGSSTSRRDFLKLLGFSTAAVTLAACEAPVIKTIPYVVKPHDIIPGIPNYYASTYFDGFDFASVLVKTREGRPIKIEPNPAGGDLGKTNARAQASVLSLYDNDKVKQPKLDGKDETFDKVDSFVIKGLEEAKASGKKIVVLSHSFASPTFKKLFAEFKAKYPTAELVTFDAFPYAAGLDAAQEVFGQRALPVYDLKGSELVVAFQADFLGDYNASSLETSYAAARKPGPNMLRHIQVESNMSLTGANADSRYRLKPSAVNKTLVEVYNAIVGGGTSDKTATEIANELKAKGSKAVVFADGSKGAQVLAHLINQKLGSVAFTGKANLLKEFDGARYQEFLGWINGGQVGVLVTNNVDPIYAHPKGEDFKKSLSKVPYVIAVADKKNEMYKAAKAVIPVANWLESWGDIEPQTGVYSLMQPTIQKIYKSRQIEESLLVWKNGKNNAANNYYDYLKASSASLLGGTSFNKALYNGINASTNSTTLSYAGGNAAQAVAELGNFKASELELVLYTKTSMGDGTQANNPWLQELPDPITRMSWDNYLTISPKDAEKFGIDNDLNARMQLDGSIVNLTVNGVTIKDVPVFVQPGQAEGSVGLALGYGKKNSGATADTGVNAYPLFDGSNLVLSGVKIEKTGEDHEFAGIQLQNTLMGRYEIAKEVPLAEFINVPFDDEHKGWNKPLEYHTISGALPARKIDLWDAFDDTDGPHFNLSIDLNSCTGCGACIIACQAENNVPVVGKAEVRMSRDMYWLRIDRYYSSRQKVEVYEGLKEGMAVPELYGTAFNKEGGALNHPADNPDVIFQPVMCQHCNHAPCETVCPVAATSHGKQGQNHMAYNRCIGTRYCANNCPYKVRRFNWFTYNLNDKFDFNMNNDLGRMVLNPDVVVRTRGVMEKCSMCIQMTQNTILEAKKEGRKVKDGEFQTACSKACSTGAMTFGDMNDKESEIRKVYASNRRYYLLEEIGTKPNVFYHTKVRNRVEK
ncbi:4Fe-4S dicluster domain-containing protein [Chryseobacterium indologenes]|uniref:4Fe-4S dicluster domain-containing protein n=1 Tax=Chryseobacterium indologenes TaxID=253 RepID=A0AAD1DVS0_CHRID|nr:MULTISPECIES: TAT-variant-translocated molybdopterin oxidoreductase [Chryseobacterium]AYZ37678.1 4Fe-4S dicluster domain-containing protein [Chryseobacterium indologenes]AZB19120.1 4Fe-4S dicluster domain-containing protein [Chryseobacterium indologenes]MBF6646567.1 TAT-variant-translocated molybdopterin oxidoreductase [Chryseobacterium indologenes]MBU3046986.1 TAT-variant-translocated molybdopterin oxidoreductase [Chryseobacterium indologenes]MEB4760414.1 TAT-variant-translocated molybdopt